MNVSERGRGDPGTRRSGVHYNNAYFAGLDVFTRPASPGGLQLLPWRESSLDGLGASGKVRSRRAGQQGGEGGGCVCVSVEGTGLQSRQSSCLRLSSWDYWHGPSHTYPFLPLTPLPLLSSFHSLTILPFSFLSHPPRTTSPVPHCHATTRCPLWPVTGVLTLAATAALWAQQGPRALCHAAGSLLAASPCPPPAPSPEVAPASVPSPSA